MEQGAGSSKKLGNGAWSKRNDQGARGKIKKEQGAKRDEKGAVKIGRKERVSKNGREQGERGKMSKGEGSIDPSPNRASTMEAKVDSKFQVRFSSFQQESSLTHRLSNSVQEEMS